MNQVDILVVDDDPLMTEGLTEILIEEGYNVTDFVDPGLALETLKKGRFTIALLDLIMPWKNGIDLLKWIKEHSPATKVIIITGFATVESAVSAMKTGATDYISKPFKVNEVQDVVKKTLEEIRFEKSVVHLSKPAGPDKILRAVSNPIRRAIVSALFSKERLRFTDLRKGLDIEDPTKLSFHLRELKGSGLVVQDSQKTYRLSASGRKTAKILDDLETTIY